MRSWITQPLILGVLVAGAAMHGFSGFWLWAAIFVAAFLVLADVSRLRQRRGA